MLPLKLRNKLFDLAIDVAVEGQDPPWDAFKTTITSYKSLTLVNRRILDEFKKLYTENRVIDITYSLDDLAALYDAHLASHTVRILRDAKFRLRSVFWDHIMVTVSKAKAAQDIYRFIQNIEGFYLAWILTPGSHNTASDDAAWDEIATENFRHSE